MSNRGKSVMAQALTTKDRRRRDQRVFGRHRGRHRRARQRTLTTQVLAEVGTEVNDHHPRQLTDDLMRAADIIVVLGSSAEVAAPDGVVVELWDTDEPSQRGIDGIDRMRVIRDDIAARVEGLTTRLTAARATRWVPPTGDPPP